MRKFIMAMLLLSLVSLLIACVNGGGSGRVYRHHHSYGARWGDRIYDRDSDLAGPGWGGGPAFILVGDIGEHISTAFIAGHVWGDEDGFSTSMLQPMLFYNLPDAWTIHYNNMITYNWDADSDDAWTVPLGLAVSKMFALKSGHGIELFAGPYYNVVRPDGAADWNIKWGINWLLP